ncbi:MAG: peptide ABC transporter substrate-binding protein [Candidatus Eremiobacteraeota bacterium]|nr:peptide ABC transporter substrate-binding protein [Candidatus Eremiobacteraeota bacterium]
MPNNIRLRNISTNDLFGARGLVGIFLATFVALAGGCTPAGPAAGGSRLQFALAADPQTLDPLFAHPDAASVEAQVARLAFEPFVDLDAAGKPVPALLAVVPDRRNGGISADGRTIVYRLRRGVRWSDGRPVTSADVLFTLRAILDPRNPVRSHEGYDLIDRAYARGPFVVAFHLKHAWAPAVTTYFSYGFSPQFVLPAHVLQSQAPLATARFGEDPSVGDGPYVFASWQRGDRLLYRANPLYWRGKPPIETVEARIVPQPSTNLVLLQSGELDWNLVAPVQLAVLKGKAGLRFDDVPTSVVAGLAINTRHAPLDDVRVRRAIAMSIDRPSISKKITLGIYPVTDTIQPQFSWAYDPAVKEPGYDPRAADALFDAAGWLRDRAGVRRKNGVALALLYVAFPESMTGVRVATAVQAELAERGVAVSVKSVSNAQLFLPETGVLASGAYDLAYVPWTMGADPDDSAVLSCDGASNYMRWCDRRVDDLERQALSATDPSARKVLYARIARITADAVPIVYLFNARYVYAYRDRMRGFAPNAFLPTWNAGAWALK